VRRRNDALLGLAALLALACTDGRTSPQQAAPAKPAATATPACNTPVPFVPPNLPAGFKHTRTILGTITQGPANHRGGDTLVAAGKPQRLIAKFAYGPLDKDLEEEEVEVFVQRGGPCGTWESVGTATTSDEEHGTKWGVEDDGGQVYFEVPEEKRLPAGVHEVRILARGDNSYAALRLYVVEAGAPAVVFDIDGTLTTDDMQVVLQILGQAADKPYVPVMRDGALDVVRTWADKGYLVVYLTGRPDAFTAPTRDWLAAKGFPPGPVRLAAESSEVLPSQHGVGAYKTAWLKRWADEADVRWAAAYGNAETDIYAYAQAGIPKDRTWIIGPNAGKEETGALTTYTDHLEHVRSQPKAR
jgi:phosphoserine phosphatase